MHETLARSPVKLSILLADAAQVAEGKLNVLGAGWVAIGPQPVPTAVALLIDVPWDQANHRHSLSIRLVSADGENITVAAPDGTQQPLRFDAQFEVGRPPGTPPGSDLKMPFAAGIGPLPLAPGRYEWRVYVNEETSPEWRAAFTMRG